MWVEKGEEAKGLQGRKGNRSSRQQRRRRNGETEEKKILGSRWRATVQGVDQKGWDGRRATVAATVTGHVTHGVMGADTS